MTDEDDARIACIAKLNELITSLDIPKQTFQSLDDLEISDIFEIFRLMCNLPSDDSTFSASSLQIVDKIISYIKRYSEGGNGFNYLNSELLVNKDVGQLTFLFQILEEIRSHKLSRNASRRSSKTSRRSSKAKASISLSIISESSKSNPESSINDSSVRDTSNSTSGPEEPSFITWNEGSSKDNSITPDSTMISDSGRSTALSDETDLNSTHSTIDKIVVNVTEDSLVSEPEDPPRKKSFGSRGSTKPPSITQFTSSRIEFDKDQMLMGIGNVTGSKRDSRESKNVLSISAIKSSSNSKSKVETSVLGSIAETLSNPSKRSHPKPKTTYGNSTEPPVPQEFKHSKSRIVFGPNASRSNHPNLVSNESETPIVNIIYEEISTTGSNHSSEKWQANKLSDSNIAINEDELLIVLSTPETENSFTTDQESFDNEIEQSLTMERISATQDEIIVNKSTVNHQSLVQDEIEEESYFEDEMEEEESYFENFLEEEGSYFDTDGKPISIRDNEESNSQNRGRVFEVDEEEEETDEDALDGHNQFLDDVVSRLQQKIDDPKSRKSSSQKASMHSSKAKNLQYDHFGKPVKQKFPYYPYGIIYPKCKSIMGSCSTKKCPSKPREPFQNVFSKNYGCQEETETKVPSRKSTTSATPIATTKTVLIKRSSNLIIGQSTPLLSDE